MPSDYAKCNGKDCPIRDKCFRFTAIAYKYQYWSEFKVEETSMGYLCHGFDKDENA